MHTPIIIVSEPDPMISGVLRVAFSDNFFVVLTSSSQEAEDCASAKVAALVVLDTARERRLAFETCARIRRSHGYAKCPIVLTANAITPQVCEAGETAGATALLAKPYSVSDLVQVVSAHVPTDDPLRWADRPRFGLAEAAVAWKPSPLPEWSAGEESRLSQNRHLLPIVRRPGQKLALVHETAPTRRQDSRALENVLQRKAK